MPVIVSTFSIRLFQTENPLSIKITTSMFWVTVCLKSRFLYCVPRINLLRMRLPSTEHMYSCSNQGKTWISSDFSGLLKLLKLNQLISEFMHQLPNTTTCTVVQSLSAIAGVSLFTKTNSQIITVGIVFVVGVDC